MTYRDLNGFLIQTPPLHSEDVEGQRASDWLGQSHSLASLIGDKDANYLHTMLPPWPMVRVLILETQAKFWQRTPL